MPVIRGAPKKHSYAICCSLRNNIYLPNTVMSPKVGNYLKDVYNSQPSLQLGWVLKLVPGNRIWAGVSCLLTASWLERLCWFQSSLSPSATGHVVQMAEPPPWGPRPPASLHGVRNKLLWCEALEMLGYFCISYACMNTHHIDVNKNVTCANDYKFKQFKKL